MDPQVIPAEAQLRSFKLILPYKMALLSFFSPGVQKGFFGLPPASPAPPSSSHLLRERELLPLPAAPTPARMFSGIFPLLFGGCPTKNGLPQKGSLFFPDLLNH